MSETVTLHTDGSCLQNPGPGGWGWAVSPDGSPCGSGGEADTTNQRMEVYAVLDAVRARARVQVRAAYRYDVDVARRPAPGRRGCVGLPATDSATGE